MNDGIKDVNTFISSVKLKDEADFYLEICDFFEFRKLGQLFDLNDLIYTYRDSIDTIKINSGDSRKACIFIKNIIESRHYNDIQRYNFYLMLHIFFDYLLFDDNLKNDVCQYMEWIEDQLDLVNEVATTYYYDFNISNLVNSISSKPANEQKTILNERKKEYLLALSKFNIPANNFDKQCNDQINIIDQLVAAGVQFSTELKSTETLEVKSDSLQEPLENNKPKLTLPKNVQNNGYVGVKHAAEYVGYSENYLRTLANKGKIPCYKPTKTGHYRFIIVDLDDWKINGMKNFQTTPDDKLIGKGTEKYKKAARNNNKDK